MVKRFPLLFLSLLLLFLIFPKPSSAANQGDVVINEFSPATDPEWIELYNPTGASINLSGWTLLFDDNPSTSQKIVFGELDNITANGFKVIEHAASSQAWLNNSGDTIILKDSTTTIDSVVYGSEAGAVVGSPSSSQSAARYPNGGTIWSIGNATKGTDNGIAPPPTNPPTPTPSPGTSPNPTPPPTQTTYPSEISLSEFMPNPADGNEWAEVYNSNNYPVTLTDWFIDDVEGGGKPPKKFSAEIATHGYFKIDLGTGFLNNSSDDVRLLDPTEHEIEKFSYHSSKKDCSWAKINGVWQLSCSPTANSANSGSSETQTDSKSGSGKQTNTTSSTIQPGGSNTNVLGQTKSATSATSPAENEESTTEEETVLTKNYTNAKILLVLGIILIAVSALLLIKNKESFEVFFQKEKDET